MSLENGPYCLEESRIVAAARNGALTGELARHAAACAVCSEAVIAITFLQEAPSGQSRINVPPAGLVYWKADLKARRERTEQAMRPMKWAEGTAIGTLAVTGVAAAFYADLAIATAAMGFCAVLAGCWWAVGHVQSRR